jgi:crotonobetainyl-CoA:carnitine CoA-transferase CaiB-like acyl-CoA transferase
LAEIFVSKPAAEWERELLAQGVGCVQVHTGLIEEQLFDDSFGRASGYVADVVHPTFDEHLRPAPYIQFSRSLTQALPGVLAGQHTDQILAAVGKSPDVIADLRARKIVA